MAVIVCRINKEPETYWGNYVGSTTKAYQRYKKKSGQKGKK